MYFSSCYILYVLFMLLQNVEVCWKGPVGYLRAQVIPQHKVTGATVGGK